MKFIKYIIIVFFATAFVSCGKEDVIETDTEVGHSKVVFFPIIETKGNQLTIVSQGSTYADEGAIATLGGQNAQFTTTGSVNTAVPGVYSLTYEAKNPEGFSATDFRTVVVIGNDVPASRDFSGTYARYLSGAPNGQTSTWTKTARGVYTVVNPGGATGVTATAVNYTGDRIVVPPQITSVGLFSSAISSTSGIYYPSATPPYYEWAIVNPTYGTALRTFKKL